MFFITFKRVSACFYEKSNSIYATRLAHAQAHVKDHLLAYTTQVNSTFRALWLVHSEAISKYYPPPSRRRERFLNFRRFVSHKITCWSASCSACVLYTKSWLFTSPLCVSVNIQHYSPPLRWIINYSPICSYGTLISHPCHECTQPCSQSCSQPSKRSRPWELGWTVFSFPASTGVLLLVA